MELFIGFAGFALIIGVSCVGGAINEWVKNVSKAKGLSGRDAKQILQELKALRQEVAELRGGVGGEPRTAGDGKDIVGRLDRLQQEMTALRDTTTEFDMSVDAALDRLEQRLEHVESCTTARAEGNEAVTVSAGRARVR